MNELFSPEDMQAILPNLVPTMADASEVGLVVGERAILPSNNRAKTRYASLTDLITETTRRLQQLPEKKLDFALVGLNDITLRLVKAESLRFTVADPSSGDTITGEVRDLGKRVHALVADKKVKKKGLNNYIIDMVTLACNGLAKIEIFQAALFPPEELESVDPKGPTSPLNEEDHIDPVHDSYSDFVAVLIEESESWQLNPSNFSNSFDNYQIYEKNGRYLAYNPEYKSGVYISPRRDDFFTHSKRGLQRMDDVIFIVRNERTGPESWQKRIRQHFLER